MAGIRTRVTCPKCGKTFDYEFVPGGSLSAIRLGKYRYMRCRECGRWALFDITAGLSAAQSRGLWNSSLVAAAAIAVLGIALLWMAWSKGIFALYVVSASTIALAALMAALGALWRRRR